MKPYLSEHNARHKRKKQMRPDTPRGHQRSWYRPGKKAARREGQEEINNDRDASLAARARDKYECRFGLPGCRRKATGVHHIVARADYRLRFEKANLLSACPSCHDWVEDNPTAAREYIDEHLLTDEEREIIETNLR